VCKREAIGATTMLRLIRNICGLDEDVVDLTFELGVKTSAVVVEEI
jgi:hypothetical protein